MSRKDAPPASIPTPPLHTRWRDLAVRRLAWILVLLVCGLALAPILWHAASSLKTPAEIARVPPTLAPEAPVLDNYAELFERRPFLTYFMNSLVISTLSSLLSVGAASLAAYPLARVGGPLRAAVASGLLVLAFFPTIMFLLPLYELVRAANLINHPWGLIVPYAALNLPLAVWLLMGFFERIPVELEEAAAMDGLTPFRIYAHIVLPMSMPAIVTAGVLVFIFSWNEFMLALTFMNAESARTVTVAVATLSGAFVYEVPWGLIAAGVIASSIPLIALVMVLERRIVAGLTAGAGK